MQRHHVKHIVSNAPNTTMKELMKARPKEESADSFLKLVATYTLVDLQCATGERINHSDLARQLNTHRTTVGKRLKVLLSYGLIESLHVR